MAMNRRRGWIAISGLSAWFSIQISGCSIMGLATGALIDANTPPFRPLVPSQVELVKPGAAVVVQLADGTAIRGVYRGVSEIAEPDAIAGEVISLEPALKVEAADGTHLIRVDQVVLIHAPTDRHAAATGFFLGLAVDVMVVAIANSPHHDAGPSCEPQPGYNPLGWSSE
jgi:hypothetical protein